MIIQNFEIIYQIGVQCIDHPYSYMVSIKLIANWLKVKWLKMVVFAQKLSKPNETEPSFGFHLPFTITFFL